MFTLFLTLLGLTSCIGVLAIAPYIGGIIALGFLVWLVKTMFGKKNSEH